MEAQSTLFESNTDAALQHVPVSELYPHPKNPRTEYREDVIEKIAGSLQRTGNFPMEHALLVRPKDGGYQIVSGHHRWKAAQRVGFDTVPAWVRQMSDQESVLELRRANTQGELSGVEEGQNIIDVIGYPDDHAGGSGQKGGLRDYCRRLDLNHGSEKEKWRAATVKQKVCARAHTLIDRGSHLREIYPAPEHLWEPLVEALVENDWSVRDTKHYRQKVEEFDVSEPWDEVFLPEAAVVSAYLATGEFSPQTVERLCDLAQSTEQRIESYDIDTDSYVDDFRSWLSHNSGTPGEGSWDPRQLKKYQREVQAELERAEEESRRMWAHGDWREHIDTLSEGEVRLVLTDPPYGIDYQSDYRLDRREDRKHEPMDNDAGGAAQEIRDAAEQLYDRLAEDAHLLVFTHWQTEWEMRAALTEAQYEVRGSLIWVKNNTGMGDPETTFAPKHERIIHAVKGSPKLFRREPDVLKADRVSTDRHPTEKPTALLKRLIRCTTVEGEKVADPFGGVASTLVAAREIDREVWGCEKNEDYHRIGQNRLST